MATSESVSRNVPTPTWTMAPVGTPLELNRRARTLVSPPGWVWVQLTTKLPWPSIATAGVPSSSQFYTFSNFGCDGTVDGRVDPRSCRHPTSRPGDGGPWPLTAAEGPGARLDVHPWAGGRPGLRPGFGGDGSRGPR